VGDTEIVVLPPDTKGLYPSLIFGLGLEFPVGQVAIFIEGRYQASTSSILVPGEDTIRHQGGVILLGVGF
jgi:hypothetical protein